MSMRNLSTAAVVFLMALALPVQAEEELPYATYTSFDKVMGARDARYPAITRVSDPGPPTKRAYTGFFFYQVLQFDSSGRYLLGLKVGFQSRDVRADDRG